MTALLVFDCDGVLVDSERLMLDVDAQALAELGLRLSDAEIAERFVGLSDAAVRAAVQALAGRPLPPDWEARMRQRYEQAFAQRLRPVEGVVAALDRIAAPACVASNGTHEKLRFTLGLTGLYERFAGRIFSATDVPRGKPAPDLFLHAAQRMGVPPRGCVVVEDSAHGVAAARAAGMPVLAFAGGVTPAARLAGPGTTVFHHMAELPALVAATLTSTAGSRP